MKKWLKLTFVKFKRLISSNWGISIQVLEDLRVRWCLFIVFLQNAWKDLAQCMLLQFICINAATTEVDLSFPKGNDETPAQGPTAGTCC